MKLNMIKRQLAQKGNMMSKNFEGATLKTQEFVDAFGSEIQKKAILRQKNQQKIQKYQL